MSEIFNLNRFWKYFKYDISNAKDNYLISLIVYGLMPVIVYFFFWIFAILIDGSSTTDPGAYLGLKISSYIIAYVGVTISFPIKAYGEITEKRHGTAWCLLPASTLEKFISMVLICCIVVPVCLLGIFYASSYALKVMVPSYGAPIGLRDLLRLVNSNSDGLMNINMSVIPLSWAESILTFLLGAIFFKKGKGGKTILCLMGIGIAISWITTLAFCHGGELSILSKIRNLTAEQVLFWFNFAINAIYIVVFAALFAGLYFRLKTIKH